MTLEIVQLVPALGGDGGVAGHARELAGALVAEGVESSTLAAYEATEQNQPQPGMTLRAREAGELEGTLTRSTAAAVVLHYSNYGYERRGCPRWLADGLERWRKNADGRRLITVFHELYATGLPWQSSFWLAPLQRRLAARVARISDGLVTSLHGYAAKLRSWSPRAPVATLPVFSTVGEPPRVTPPQVRRRQLVLFGSSGLRARAYARAPGELAATVAALGIERIVDIGAGGVAPPEIAGVPIEVHGFLTPHRVSALLAESLAGFLYYPPAFLGKSTVFAGYCAHGMVPVCTWAGGVPVPAAPPFWQPRVHRDGAAESVARAAHEWYGEHSLARQAAVYGTLLR